MTTAIRHLLFALFLIGIGGGPTWADSLETALMPGQVIEGHAKWEETCTACHKRFDKAAQTALCLACHTDIRRDLDQTRRFHGRFQKPRECRECHTEHQGRTAQIAPLNEQTFDHSQTDFVLRGTHADLHKVPCKACHKPTAKFREAPSSCYACHQKDDKHQGRAGKTCATCHIENTWKTIRFDHNTTTYPLTGKHSDVPCRVCHADDRYKNTPTDCYSCHKHDDKHRGQEGTRCADCHDTHSWKKARFDHNTSRFPLLGKHARATCKACHAAPAFKDAPTDCYGCHKKDDRHNGRAGEKCEQCHTEQNWKGIRFDHSKTPYPLRHKHAEVACKACHLADRYHGTPTDCYSCHKHDDKHRGQEGTHCETCHTEQSWHRTTFDHAKTHFPLLGKHARATCKACHATPAFKDAPTDCYGCHRKDDAHKGTYGKNCEACHGANDWKAVTFDHDIHTHYPLRGKHRTALCASCHKGNLYTDTTPTDCQACHQKDDTHKGRFSNRCERCHTERDWKILLFEHDRDTAYPLKDAHRRVKCNRCHSGVLYHDKTPSDCHACHAKDDKHEGRFGEACERCHTERNWTTLRFDHDRDTAYPLLGRHRTIACRSCHRGILYKEKTPTSCYACHKGDDVHRRTLGSRCQDCHNSRDWTLWDFNHDTRTTFKLEGGHRGLACRDCHTTQMNERVVVSSACVTCHKKDDVHENHFGPRCEHCHTTLTWRAIKPGSSSAPGVRR